MLFKETFKTLIRDGSVMIIDAKGYVIGLMSSKAGNLERLAPVSYARDLLAETRRNQDGE